MLNPLGRFDSYWVLSDALGIVDLSTQRSLVLRRLFQKRERASQGYPLSYEGFHQAAIICYSAATVLVFGWFVYAAIVVSGPFAAQMRLATTAIGREFKHGGLVAALAGLVGILPSLIMLGFAIYRLMQMLRPLLRKLRHRKINAVT